MSEFLTDYQRSSRRQYIWLGVIFTLALLGEMLFDVAEHAVGKYLVWQNPGRQKIGRSWEAEQQRIAAGVRLESVTRERRRQEMELQSISNFEELVQYVETNQQALLLPSQFLQIYRQLPEFFQPLLLDPDSLFADSRAQRLANVLVDGNRLRLNLVMLDAYNRIIRQTSLNEEKLGLLINNGKEQNLDIRSAARFANYLFNANEFLDLFDSLHPLRRRQFIQEIPLLAEAAGQITAVGISNQHTTAFVEVAFAIASNRAYIYFLPEDWVMDLLSADREKAFEFYRMRRQML